jgi:uncharacterized membrane protein YdjX (TVP38/TMEM64 family)
MQRGSPRRTQGVATTMTRWAPGILLVAVGTALVVGRSVRTGLDLPLAPTAIHDWVAAFGWRGPSIFLVLLVFRQFLALPAIVLLAVGGLCFGTLAGTALGALGLILSGVMKFSVARAIGRDWLRRRGGGRLERAEAFAARLGPAVVAVATAHPLGPLSPLHWVAGLSPLSLASFVGALAVGAPVRAFAYSFFGEALLDTGSATFRAAALLLGASIVVPLLIFRRRLRPLFRGGVD